MNNGVDVGAAEAAQWAAFARRFLPQGGYRYGTALTWVLGRPATAAIIGRLKHAETVLDARDALACNEAAAVLTGALEDDA